MKFKEDERVIVKDKGLITSFVGLWSRMLQLTDSSLEGIQTL